MLEAIPPQLVTGGGIVGMVTLVGWFLATGRAVTRREHDNRVADKDAVIADLRETLKIRDQEAAIRTEQIGKLLTNTDLTVALLQGLTREVRRADLEA